MPRLRFLIIDDHPLFLGGLKAVLNALPDQCDFVEAGTAQAALASINDAMTFDLICVDFQLPDLDGIEFLNELRSRRVPAPVAIVSAIDSASIVDAALKAGANGYITKATPPTEMLRGIRTLLSSGRYVSPDLRDNLDRYRAGLTLGGDQAITLTRRQRQVLDLMAQGMTNAQIGEALKITESTIKGHATTLFAIFNADNRTACINEARRLGVVR